MPNSIQPVDGSVLPAQKMYHVAFTYSPTGVVTTFQINVNWSCPDNADVAFQNVKTVTDETTGVANNQILYKGVATPATPPTITLKDDSGNDLLTFNYDFRNVEFVGADANGGGISYPEGIQTVWPFGSPGDPLQNGLQVSVQAVEIGNPTALVENLAVAFTAQNSALKFYTTAGVAITPMPNEEGATTKRYIQATDADGKATVIAMSASSGIFSVDAGGSSAAEARGVIVVLDEFAPADEDTLDPLQFPTLDYNTNKVMLDDTPGPLFPVEAPTSMLSSEGGPVQPTAFAVVVSYPAGQPHSEGKIVLPPTAASTLASNQAVIPKAKISTTAETSFYYLASNGVASWQSGVISVGAVGKLQDGPDQTVPRLNQAPGLVDATVVNRPAIIGGLRVVASAYLMSEMVQNGVTGGDDYAFFAYLDGWDGNSARPKSGVGPTKGKIPMTGFGGALLDIIPQAYFVGYGHNGNQTGTMQLELVCYPAGKDPIYSALGTFALDTTG
jgi:hypothetical protein